VFFREWLEDFKSQPMSEEEFKRLYLCVWVPSNVDYRRQSMLQEHNTEWFIKANGQMIGPFASKEIASAKMLSENISGSLVPKTKDGQEILMG
jgi:hypothetical protein